MDENRASTIFAAGTDIVIEHDNKVVEAVFAPQSLMASLMRQSDLAVVEGAVRVVAPPIAWFDPAGRERPRLAYDPIWAEETFEEVKGPRRRCPVALAFPVPDAGLPDGALDHGRPSVKPG